MIAHAKTAELPAVSEVLPSFEPYHAIARIGRGGMAEVYRAFHIDAHGQPREVVLKRMWPHLAGNQRMRDMFLAEAELAMLLDHPNLVRGFGVAVTPDGWVQVLEYVDGVDLAQLMNARKAAIGWPDVARIGWEVARGLSWAHALKDRTGAPLGLVHRDVSPSNVMLTRDGRVKLLDFGIAKPLSVARVSSLQGTVKGKFGYMPPEQLDGSRVDQRADQSALGVLLYELLIGARLFGDQPGPMLLAERRRAVPRPSCRVPSVPPALDDVIQRLLQPDRERRFPSCAAAAQALSRLVPPAQGLAALVQAAPVGARPSDTETLSAPTAPTL